MYTCRKDKISQKVEQQIRKIFATCKLVKGGANFPKDLALLSGPGPGRDNASFIHSKFLPGAPPKCLALQYIKSEIVAALNGAQWDQVE